MFVYIVGNAEQNMFRLGIASDPFKQVSRIQESSPHEVSILCMICVQNKNCAVLVEKLGRQELSKYEGVGGWILGVPEFMSVQLTSGHYLRSVAGKAGIKIVDRDSAFDSAGKGDLQRLTSVARRKGLVLEDILEKVELAYDQGVAIDKMI